MHPRLIPGWPLHSYGLMLVVGFYTAYFLSRWTAKKERIDPNRMIDVLVIGAVLGIVGSRIVYVIQYRDQIESFWDLFAIWKGGLVFYGGLIAAVAGLAIYVARKKLPVWKLGDAAAPAIMLGLALGRIGCLLNGCCWGARCDEHFPLGVRFPRLVSSTVDSGDARPESQAPSQWRAFVRKDDTDRLLPRKELISAADKDPDLWRRLSVRWSQRVALADGRRATEVITGSYAFRQHLVQYPRELTPEDTWSLTVHPSQLYSSFSALVICGLLLLWRKHRRRPGEVLALMACLYSIARFFVEQFRNDTDPVLGELTMGQATSVLVFAVALVAFVFCRLRPSEA